MEAEIKLSVRQLVEFILRSGNIDNRFGGFDRANQGARLHRKLQKAAGQHYQPEVSLSLKQEYQGISFFVEGRADGIITEETGITVDEIKTTGMPLQWIDDSISKVHWAQAKCYGYFYCVKKGLSSLCIQLTYCHIETEEIRILKKNFTNKELEDFYFSLLDQYLSWAKLELNWIRTRNQSIQKLVFPFPSYRKGQRPLAVAVYKTITANEKLFCQAPTGIGKTISTLFPSVKAIGEEKASKIFYLTAKTITRQSAENALQLLRQSAVLRLKSITLTAKEKICFLEKPDCNPDACSYAKGHFDRINQAVYELIFSEDSFTRQQIEFTAKKYEVCPYELSLDLSLWSDCIICDYNYVFDPVVNLKRFFSEEKKTDYIFLIDEAHNLADRAKEMYSAELNKHDFLELKKLLDKKEKKLRSLLHKINQEFLDLKKQLEEKPFLLLPKPPESFQKLLYQFTASCEQWLEQNKKAEDQSILLQLYFQVLFYQKISEFYDSHYTTFVHTKNKDISLRLLCLDPSALLNNAMKLAKAAILFSATLTPLSYFYSILGGDEKTKKLLLPSPFPLENMKLIAACHISTRYQDREQNKQAIVDLIFQAVNTKKGNYMIYFPSYQYRDAVHDLFLQQHSELEIILQQPGITEQEKEFFLSRFSEENEKTLIGFCVLGGIYSEGIDLKGDRLIGVIVIGVGLPQIGPEQNILRDYYHRLCHRGYEYAYQYPGMNKVLQAAGRLIRDENDRGMVLLIEERFSNENYKILFPPHWRHCQFYHETKKIITELEKFWSE